MPQSVENVNPNRRAARSKSESKKPGTGEKKPRKPGALSIPEQTRHNPRLPDVANPKLVKAAAALAFGQPSEASLAPGQPLPASGARAKGTARLTAQSARQEVLTKLQSRLDEAGSRLAALCMDHVLSQAGNQLALLVSDEFINAIERSIVSVINDPVQQGMPVLAFKLNFNLNCRSLLERAKGVFVNPDAKWDAALEKRFGPMAKMSLLAGAGMSQLMLDEPDSTTTVFRFSLLQSLGLLDAIVSGESKGPELVADINISMALRNISVREFERHGKLDPALAGKLAEAAKALKEKRPANPISWTIQLMETADKWHRKH